MIVSTERKVRTVKFIPKPGEQIFSVNLAMVDLSELTAVGYRLGFKPEVVQVEYRSGATEIHAMLWQGPIEEVPYDLEAKYDELSELFNPDAIRFAVAAKT